MNSQSYIKHDFMTLDICIHQQLLVLTSEWYGCLFTVKYC